jgi:hypothetical protein
MLYEMSKLGVEEDVNFLLYFLRAVTLAAKDDASSVAGHFVGSFFYGVV